MLNILTVFGTRPEAIKMAPLVKELKNCRQYINCKVAVTAQHREMLDQVLRLFDIQPDYDLNIMKPRQSLFEVTSRALLGLEEVFNREKLDLVLVHGDTTTTFVAALAAYYLQLPVGHVEAGLRTGNRYSPFPEEMNRHLTASLTDLHFAPTATAKKNLLREGVSEKRIFVTGNTVIDALLATVREDYCFNSPLLDSIDYKRKKILLVTTHRRENLGDPLRTVYQALRSIVQDSPEVEVIFPVHKNPAVSKVVYEELGDLERTHLVEPMDYEPFVNLMRRSYIVLTDSGGLQEEAPALGKPVLVLRNTTERPEAVISGTVKVIGTEREVVFGETLRLLRDERCYRQMAEAVNPYGDGKASKRIIEAILYFNGLREVPPDEYLPG
jgi:UDP-N-acetylglucosamine 2-epimerase (non-hydrolysing)